MNTYSVVEFIDDCTIEAVPTNWIKNGMCAWPTTKKDSALRKLIERKSLPNDIEYNQYKIKVLKTTSK